MSKTKKELQGEIADLKGALTATEQAYDDSEKELESTKNRGNRFAETINRLEAEVRIATGGEIEALESNDRLIREKTLLAADYATLQDDAKILEMTLEISQKLNAVYEFQQNRTDYHAFLEADDEDRGIADFFSAFVDDDYAQDDRTGYVEGPFAGAMWK